MKTDPILKNTYRIRGTEISPEYLLKYESLIDFYQDSFACTCADAAMTAYDLHPQRKSWIISDFYMEFGTHRPRWRDEVYTEAWIQRIKGIRTIRHFVAYHQKQIVAKGIGTWLVIDEDSRRPVFLEEVSQRFAIHNNNCLPDFSFSHIPTTHNESIAPYTFKIKYSDIDFNHHFNSVHYFTQALETIKEELILQRQLLSVQMKFLKEVHCGDTIQVHCKKEDTIYYHSLWHHEEEIFRMRSIWK